MKDKICYICVVGERDPGLLNIWLSIFDIHSYVRIHYLYCFDVDLGAYLYLSTFSTSMTSLMLAYL